MDILKRAQTLLDEMYNATIIGGKEYKVVGHVVPEKPPTHEGTVLSMGDNVFVVISLDPTVLRNLETGEDTVV